MAEMVERVAKAIFETSNHWDHDDRLPAYSELTVGLKAQWQDAARAAIEAMRDIPPELIDISWGFGVADWNKVLDRALTE